MNEIEIAQILDKELCGRHLWSTGYFVMANGDVTTIFIKKHLELQCAEPRRRQVQDQRLTCIARRGLLGDFSQPQFSLVKSSEYDDLLATETNERKDTVP